jgi:hypothetical protein
MRGSLWHVSPSTSAPAGWSGIGPTHLDKPGVLALQHRGEEGALREGDGGRLDGLWRRLLLAVELLAMEVHERVLLPRVPLTALATPGSSASCPCRLSSQPQSESICQPEMDRLPPPLLYVFHVLMGSRRGEFGYPY